LYVLAGADMAKSRSPLQDCQPTQHDVKVGDDLTKARVNPDNVAKPGFVENVQRKFVPVKKMSPLKDFDLDTNELPAKG